MSKTTAEPMKCDRCGKEAYSLYYINGRVDGICDKCNSEENPITVMYPDPDGRIKELEAKNETLKEIARMAHNGAQWSI